MAVMPGGTCMFVGRPALPSIAGVRSQPGSTDGVSLVKGR